MSALPTRTSKWWCAASTGKAKTYELLVCDIISVGAERLRTPVVLSQPSFIGKEAGGIHAHSFLECDVVFRKDSYANAVLSSCTHWQNHDQGVDLLAPSTVKIIVVTPPERKYSVWIGESTLSSLSTFQQMWISKRKYVNPLSFRQLVAGRRRGATQGLPARRSS